jgi:Tol biopolymer transport system component
MEMPAFLFAALLTVSTTTVSPFSIETDATGCKIEHIAGIAGENHVLFRGVSPDGNWLALGWDRTIDNKIERGAYLVDLRSGERRELPGINNAASFSPDGKRLVAANYPGPRELKTEIVELDLATGTVRSLAPDPALEWLPSYSRDGKRVVFNSTRSGASDIYTVDIDTGRINRITSDDRYEAHAQLSDDGRQLLFHRQVKGSDYELVIRNLQNTKEAKINPTDHEEAYPEWSSDQKKIAFASDIHQATGSTDIYVMDANGKKPIRLTSHSDKDAYPTWSPDGRSLFYMRQSKNGVGIFRLRMKNGKCEGSK